MSDLNRIGGIHYDMMRRCYNPNSIAYKQYGAKGITVCQEWHDRETFRTWALANGYKKGLRINRIDPTKGYTPENCIFGEKNKAKHGYNELVKTRSKINKIKKAEIGLKRIIDSPLYKTYTSMHTRCENNNHKAYKDYGGRGITVCDEWSGKDGFYNFSKWSINNGWTYGLSLDRRDNDNGYSPDNCRWVPWSIQGENKRNVILYDYKGFKMCLANIARLEKINAKSLRYRVNVKGMSVYDAVKEIKSSAKKN